MKYFFLQLIILNDPFDSTIPLRYDVGSNEQIFNLFVKLIRKDNPNLTEDEVRRIARNEMNYDDVRGKNRIQNTIDNQREIIATKYGIFSASYRFDSILMWSHYANLHRGLCIRINCKKFKEYIEEECPKDDCIIVWDKTEYMNDYPILNPFELSDYELIMKSLLIKSAIWMYEEEIRFILFTYANKVLSLPNGIIDEIILGCRIQKDCRKEIIELAKEKDIQITQAYRKENSFGIGFIKVNV